MIFLILLFDFVNMDIKIQVKVYYKEKKNQVYVVNKNLKKCVYNLFEN